jgi:hypothetical protein
MKTSPSVPERGAPSSGTVYPHENSKSAEPPGASGVGSRIQAMVPSISKPGCTLASTSRRRGSA